MVELQIQQTSGRARAGVISTAHGQILTPIFMPVGTAGTVKGVTPEHLTACGVQIVLANTYHMMLRPGADVVADLGGLHRLMAWPRPILTDSGGYQVFSLAEMRKLTDEGVTFRSHVDGSAVQLTPEGCMDIQSSLGADIIMQLDECPPGEAPREDVSSAVERSARWVVRCKQAWQRNIEAGRNTYQSLFGIQQGGVHVDLRAESAKRIVELDLPGYAIGGLSVGEGHEQMVAVLDHIDEQLPKDRPRYLMGVGEPRDMLAAVLRGVDMFDCVLPTRNGRNGQAFTWQGRLRMRNASHMRETRPLDGNCPCYTCRNFSRGSLRHYFMAQEMLGPTLLTIHNLAFFAQFLAAIRTAIFAGDLESKSQAWLAAMYREPDKDD
jgi:queuine tRNA-ribosyltransferase